MSKQTITREKAFEIAWSIFAKRKKNFTTYDELPSSIRGKTERDFLNA